nr:integrase, catalytic region, zinc finger, CCHC-type, peptidase aspartic, catalytic [Tanacetum cinerariifolium]
VNCCTDDSGSQPRSNTKKNRISPAKGVNKMKVKEHPRTNTSYLRTTDRVDSSSRSKNTIINSNSDSVCQACCSKHMKGDRSRLMNFMKKFIRTVRFGNDHFGDIIGYGDYMIGDSVISKHSCYVRDMDGVELIKGSRGSNLYTISVEDMMKSSIICLLSKVSKNKSWLTPASIEPSCHAEYPLIYAALGLTDNASESDEEVPPVVEVEAQDEGQAGPNPGVLTECQAGSDTSDDAEPQPQSSLVVHAGPNLEHIDLEATDVSTQLHPEQLDKGYFSFGDLFFNDKPSEVENKKTTAETEAESMVFVTIQQDRSAIPRMTTPKAHEDHMMIYEALEKSINCGHTNELLKDLAEARRKKKKRHDSPKTPPGSVRAFGSSQVPPPPPPPLSTNKEDLHMDDDMDPDEHVHSSDDEDIGNAHIPK